MAANTATGLIIQLIVGTSAAKIIVSDEEDKENESFLLFTDSDGATPDRVGQSMWLSLCRDAILGGKRVQVESVDVNNAQIRSLTLLPG